MSPRILEERLTRLGLASRLRIGLVASDDHRWEPAIAVNVAFTPCHTHFRASRVVRPTWRKGWSNKSY